MGLLKLFSSFPKPTPQQPQQPSPQPQPMRTQISFNEVLLLEYCKKKKFPSTSGEYPKFWQHEYGINNVEAALFSLRQRGFVDMVKGKFILTAQGENEVSKRPYVLFMHQNKTFMPFSIPRLEQILSVNPCASFRDIIWREYQNQYMSHAQRGDNSLMFIDNLNMGHFLMTEGRYRDAIPLIAQAIFYDMNLNGSNFATGNIKTICLAMKKSNIDTAQLSDILSRSLRDSFYGKHKYKPEDVAKKIVTLVKEQNKADSATDLIK